MRVDAGQLIGRNARSSARERATAHLVAARLIDGSRYILPIRVHGLIHRLSVSEACLVDVPDRRASGKPVIRNISTALGPSNCEL